MVLTVDVRIQDQIILIITHLKKQIGYKYPFEYQHYPMSTAPMLKPLWIYTFRQQK